MYLWQQSQVTKATKYMQFCYYLSYFPSYFFFNFFSLFNFPIIFPLFVFPYLFFSVSRVLHLRVPSRVHRLASFANNEKLSTPGFVHGHVAILWVKPRPHALQMNLWRHAFVKDPKSPSLDWSAPSHVISRDAHNSTLGLFLERAQKEPTCTELCKGLTPAFPLSRDTERTQQGV